MNLRPALAASFFATALLASSRSEAFERQWHVGGSLGYTALKLDTNAALSEALALYRSDGWSEIPAYTSFPATHWLGKTL